ncbi:MAG: hypothetical protein LUG96_11455 [Tannerellaceae bacterium]|nr:hypothetical protein [Tannerellaceae bacterium]
MAPKLHYFNPGHETAVLYGKQNYTPSKAVSIMMRDLAFLPAWYSDPKDYIITTRNKEALFLSGLPDFIRPDVNLIGKEELFSYDFSGEEITFNPWGISPSVIHSFKHLNQAIKVSDWKKEYRYLTSRQAAIDVYKEIKKWLSYLSFPDIPVVFTEEIYLNSFLEKIPQVIKTPYSSSGRGLLWIKEGKITVKEREWIQAMLTKQGFLSIEPVLNKIQDFALEFYSDGKGKIEFKAISVFQTCSKGAYTGNYLGIENEFLSQIYREIGEETYHTIKTILIKVLEVTYAFTYEGYLGVDMMLYRKSDGTVGIHPCIEINLRHTMGLLASCLYTKYLAPASRGTFYIKYEGKQGKAYEKHTMDQEKYPLEWEKEKIKKGYLALCPVDNQTEYRAYIRVE